MKKVLLYLLILSMITVFTLAGCKGETGETEEVEESDEELSEEVVDEDREERTHFTSDDGKIEFALDNVERTKVLPDEIVKITVPQQVGDTSKEGYDFIVIDLTIASITDGYIGFTSFAESSTLIDNSGAEFISSFLTVQGVEFYDSEEGLAGEMELPKGSRWTIVFEIPEDSQPVKVELAYVFFGSWSELGQYQSEEERYIDIILY